MRPAPTRACSSEPVLRTVVEAELPVALLELEPSPHGEEDVLPDCQIALAAIRRVPSFTRCRMRCRDRHAKGGHAHEEEVRPTRFSRSPPRASSRAASRCNQLRPLPGFPSRNRSSRGQLSVPPGCPPPRPARQPRRAYSVASPVFSSRLARDASRVWVMASSCPGGFRSRMASVSSAALSLIPSPQSGA